MTGSGTLLGPPGRPVLIAASNDCHRLVENTTQGVKACATAASSRGVITGVVVGQAHQLLVNIYLRQGTKARLVLTSVDSMLAAIDLHVVDPEHDGNPKVAVVHRTSAQPAALLDSYDLVDIPGKVSVHRNARAVRLDPAGGLLDWTSGSTSPDTYTRSLIRYEGGAWHVVSAEPARLPSGNADGL